MTTVAPPSSLSRASSARRPASSSGHVRGRASGRGRGLRSERDDVTPASRPATRERLFHVKRSPSYCRHRRCRSSGRPGGARRASRSRPAAFGVSRETSRAAASGPRGVGVDVVVLASALRDQRGTTTHGTLRGVIPGAAGALNEVAGCVRGAVFPVAPRRHRRSGGQVATTFPGATSLGRTSSDAGRPRSSLLSGLLLAFTVEQGGESGQPAPEPSVSRRMWAARRAIAGGGQAASEAVRREQRPDCRPGGRKPPKKHRLSSV